MLSPRRSKSSQPSQPATPLDRKQQALREKEEQLRQAAEQLRQLIDDAPRKREEQTRRRREQLASDRRLNRSALVDKRYDVATTANPQFGQRPLRSERRDGKLQFVLLCIILLVILFFVLQVALNYL